VVLVLVLVLVGRVGLVACRFKLPDGVLFFGQVRSHCGERGELLSGVRAWLVRHAWWLDNELQVVKGQCEAMKARVMQLEEDHAKRMASKMKGSDRRRSLAMIEELATLMPGARMILRPSIRYSSGTHGSWQDSLRAFPSQARRRTSSSASPTRRLRRGALCTMIEPARCRTDAALRGVVTQVQV
jgi:hypothetical protein